LGVLLWARYPCSSAHLVWSTHVGGQGGQDQLHVNATHFIYTHGFSTAPLYRVTSLIRKRIPIGPYRRTMPRVLWGSRGMGVFLWARYPCTSPATALGEPPHWLDSKKVMSPASTVRETRQFTKHIGARGGRKRGAPP